jgi:hypothetical protein
MDGTAKAAFTEWTFEITPRRRPVAVQRRHRVHRRRRDRARLRADGAFRLDVSVGFLDTQFDSITAPPPFGPVPTATATLDSSLPFAPETQGHVGISYAFRLGGGFR